VLYLTQLGTDAKEFKPERWLNNEGSLRKESQIKFPAFHAGPRICLGQNLATQEAVSILTLLVRQFDFEMTPGQEIGYADSLTLPMKNGLKVRVRSRK
jgi:cytochrome P450